MLTAPVNSSTFMYTIPNDRLSQGAFEVAVAAVSGTQGNEVEGEMGIRVNFVVREFD